jgi:hypothetical protein
MIDRDPVRGTMQVTVRRAEAKDSRFIIDELRKFSEFFGTKKRLFGDDKYVFDGLMDMVTNHVMMVAEDADGSLMGFIGGYLLKHPYNPEITVLQEAFFWVTPERRRSRAGALLLRAFIDHGRQHATWITFALVEEKSEMREEHLTSLGFRLHERSYLMEVG